MSVLKAVSSSELIYGPVNNLVNLILDGSSVILVCISLVNIINNLDVTLTPTDGRWR